MAEPSPAYRDKITEVIELLAVTHPKFQNQCLFRGSLKDIPVIFLTSRDKPKDYKTGKDAGAVLYMVKPVKPDQLLHMVQMLSTRAAQ